MNKNNNNLVTLRNKHKYTQQEVADYLGVSLRAYRGYEKSPITLPMECAIKLSDKYNVSLDYLLNRYEYTTIGNEYIINNLGLSQTSIDTIQGVNKWSEKETEYSNASGIDILNYILSNPLLFHDLIHSLRLYLLKNDYSTLCTLEFIEGTREYKPLPYQLLCATNGKACIDLNTDDILEKTALENLHKLLYELQELYKNYAPKQSAPDIPGQTHINDFLQD